MVFAMAGGGTGGHVMPALAVARELANRGHSPFFIGTRAGLESRLVPAAGFAIEYIEIGALNRVGVARVARTLCQLPLSTLATRRILAARRPRAIFSMGGYVAGPASVAAWSQRIPIVLMEPNAIPGFTNRHSSRFAARALVNFEETVRWFPAGRAEVTGVPVRQAFFDLPAKPRDAVFTVLITGGSQGSRTLNNAARESWGLFRASGLPLRLIHQAGRNAAGQLAGEFADSGLAGEVVPFIEDMPAAFAQSDVVVCRSGAGAVAEVAAAGKPAVLVPFPFAADQHQLRNAEAMREAGAARVVLDREMNGARLVEEVSALAGSPCELESMSAAARKMAHPNAARRAADVLEELAR